MQIELSELIEACGGSKIGTQELPFEIGQQYLIRTVTLFHTGRVKAIVGHFLILESAAWIADTGRFSECVSKCECGEVEPFKGYVFVNADTIVDATVWSGVLPTEKK